jgi:hypothetical protein
MKHSTGISDSYYRGTEQELLEDYLRAAYTLSIDNDRLYTNMSSIRSLI